LSLSTSVLVDLIELSSLADHEVYNLGRSNRIQLSWLPARCVLVQIGSHVVVDLEHLPEVSVGILVHLLLGSLRKFHLLPHGAESNVSFGLGGHQIDSVVDEKRFPNGRRHIKSGNGDYGHQKDPLNSDELQDVVVPLWLSTSGEEVLENDHGEGVVESDVLVVVQDELVEHLVVLVDDSKRKLSESVVNSVIGNCKVGGIIYTVQGNLEKTLALFSIEETVGVEGVSLVDTRVADGRSQEVTSVEVEKRGHMEAKEEVRTAVQFVDETSKIGIQSNDLDEDLASAKLLFLAVINIKEDLDESVWLEVEDRREGDEWKPHIGEDSGNVGNISIVSCNVSSSEGFFRGTAESHHRPIYDVVQKQGSGHVGGPVRTSVHDLLLADDEEEIEGPERKEPYFGVGREVRVEDDVQSNGKHEGTS